MQYQYSKWLLSGLCAVWVATAGAKAPTVELSIAGPGLGTPVHTTDPAVTRYSVWGDRFAKFDAGHIPPPENGETPFQVHFWVGIHDTSRVAYVVDYRPATTTSKALVCLPGAGDRWYRTNSASIVRDGLDGHCFAARAQWSDAIDRAISAR